MRGSFCVVAGGAAQPSGLVGQVDLQGFAAAGAAGLAGQQGLLVQDGHGAAARAGHLVAGVLLVIAGILVIGTAIAMLVGAILYMIFLYNAYHALLYGR